MESTNQSIQHYDLMFITDATASMGRFLSDLKLALPQIFDLVRLTKLIDRISVLAFRDYCDLELIEWSGWSSSDHSSLLSFVEGLDPYGGGDEPEAVKTGLLKASEKVEKPTICILYVDAPPHHKYKDQNPGDNYKQEVDALGATNAQWLNVCRTIRDRQMRVYPMFPSFYTPTTYSFYASLAEFTNGQCVQIASSSVVRATIGVLLNLADVEFEYDNMCKNVTKKPGVNFEEILAENVKHERTECYTTGPVSVEVIDDIKKKIGDPIKNFQMSEEYKDLVFKVFHNLLMPERVLAFTYNTLFGKLWREICKLRKDPRRDALVERLGHTVTVLSESDRAILQTFIDESYDSTDEIEQILLPYGVDGPFYVIDHENHLSRKGLFEIGLSCAPSAVQSVLQLLTGLRITSQLPSRDCKLTFIPVNLPSALKFKLLPHLMRPGTMFSLRLSAIMATLAKISGSILRDDATQYLHEIKGKWIDLELPECNSVDFARLMMQIKDDALTDDEKNQFRAIIVMSSLKRNREIQIDVETSYTSYKAKRPDHKDECKKCGQWRSLTLLLEDTCALCLGYDGKDCLEPKTAESWMCECRKCLVHYAVYKVDELKVRAKCHFCRLGQSSPFVTCQSCNNKFLYQRSLPLPNYTCAVCTESNGRVGEKCKVTVAKYIEQNGSRFIGIDIDATTFFDDRNRITKMPPEEKLKAMRNFDNISEDDLMNHSLIVGELTKPVWNVKEVQQEIQSLLTKLKLSQCMICFEEFPLDKLNSICGLTKSGCSITACRKCLNSWYNQLAPGRICQPAQLVCCYCKRVPQIKVVRQYNRLLCTLMNTMDVTAFDPSYIYAWCVKCFVIKQAMPRECGQPEQQELIDFKCADCIHASQPSIARECPKCKVLTEKYGGCNHIACNNERIDGTKCDAHWCWVCGKLSTESKIYVHLSRAHGGWFAPEDNFEGVDEAFEDDEDY